MTHTDIEIKDYFDYSEKRILDLQDGWNYEPTNKKFNPEFMHKIRILLQSIHDNCKSFKHYILPCPLEYDGRGENSIDLSWSASHIDLLVNIPENEQNISFSGKFGHGMIDKFDDIVQFLKNYFEALENK